MEKKNKVFCVIVFVLISFLIYLLSNNRSYTKEIKALNKERSELTDSINKYSNKISNLQIQIDSIEQLPEFVDSIKYIKNEVTEKYTKEGSYVYNLSDDSLFLFFSRELSQKTIFEQWHRNSVKFRTV